MLNPEISISTYIWLLIMSDTVKQNYFTLTACYMLLLVNVIKLSSQTIFTACNSLEHAQESIKQTLIKYDLKIKGCTRNTHACFYLMSITQNINRLKKMQNSTFAWVCNLPWCQVISGDFRTNQCCIVNFIIWCISRHSVTCNLHQTVDLTSFRLAEYVESFLFLLPFVATKLCDWALVGFCD